MLLLPHPLVILLKSSESPYSIPASSSLFAFVFLDCMYYPFQYQIPHYTQKIYPNHDHHFVIYRAQTQD